MAILGQVHFTIASLLAIAQAAIGLAVAFGAGLSPAEQHAVIQIVTALAAVLPVGGAIIGHAQIGTTSSSTGGGTAA